MKKTLLFVLLVSALFFSFEQLSNTQTKPERPKIIALKSDEPNALAYDAGRVRFIASSEDTGGAWSLVELTEMPGYKTPWHRHPQAEEAFYVLEGVLTARIADRTYELPAGSYVLIPRGTPHAQGNLGRVPVRFLVTATPGGLERFFRDRVELFKTVKPDNPEFMKRMTEIIGRHDVEVLGPWDPQK
jgi:quercetin dioxygenase-like cupin family protein